MSNTVKKKAVTVVRLTKKAGKQGEKPVVTDIQPGKVFDCPKDLVEELTAAGAITAPGKATPKEASEATPPVDDEDDDQDDSDGDGDGDDEDGDGDVVLSKDALIQKAKGLGVKGVNKNWSVAKLNEVIAAAEAEAAEGGDGDDEDVM